MKISMFDSFNNILVADRNLEYGLKWMTAILSIFAIVMFFAIIFCCCWAARRRREREYFIKYGVPMNKHAPIPGDQPKKAYTPVTTHYEDAPPAYANNTLLSFSYYFGTNLGQKKRDSLIADRLLPSKNPRSNRTAMNQAESALLRETTEDI